MKLIENPTTLAERIVNAIVADIYGRSGGDAWFDSIDEDIMRDEVIPGLVDAAQRVLDGRPPAGDKAFKP